MKAQQVPKKLGRRVHQRLREELLAVETKSPTMVELDALSYLDCVVREMMGPHVPMQHEVPLKALMFTLLRAFEFELPVDPKDITTIRMFTQRPALRTELSKGGQMPLVVRPYGRTILGWP
ncbi:hypothetical protein BD414DRAFT_508609 [Trametes punicea]|nr:hypothetical protein BD414DRAFT_508609 [Trametes punicea]